MQVSTSPDDTLVTYSLGSCLGVTVYDTSKHMGGMIHCMLPLSKVDPAKAATTPCMFVDGGIPLLLNTMFKMGAKKDTLIIKAAGASNVIGTQDLFKIGERNFTVFRKLMWKNNLLIKAHDVGGNISRTMRLEISTGKLVIRSQGQEKEL